MKTHEETLRKALLEMQEHWRKWYPADIFDGSSGDTGALEVVRLRKVMNEALDATADGPQLGKLRGWLQDLMDEAQQHKPTPKFQMMFPTIFVHDVIKYIADEFGVGEEA